MKEFTPEEKCQLADKIIDLYFKQNFGSLSKSDLETFLFSEYIEHCLDANENIDDYVLSKQLGITQSRIRSLKERKELKYPRKGFDWKKSFAEEIKNAKYDQKDHYVKIIIQDINVMNEVRHWIEEKGWYDECSLNSKLLRVPLSCFAEICIEDEDVSKLFSEDTKKALSKLGNENTAIEELLKDFSKGGFKRFLMSASKEFIKEVLKIIPFGGLAAEAFEFLGNVIEGV